MNLDYQVADGVATFTINNPPVNVFTPELHKQFAGLLKSFLTDDSVRVGILTGAGERAFCAGDDVKTQRPVRTQAELVRRHMSLRHEGESLEYPGWEKEVMLLGMRRYKPIIAAVNGVTMGQGMVYLMHLTDIRLASSTARFGLPEIAYGMGGAGGSTRLEHHIPPVAAMWLALTGEPIDAETALRYNLVNEVVAPDALMKRAHEVAALIMRHPALAIRTEMEAISRTRDMTKEQTLEYIGNLYRLQRVAFGTELPLAKKPAPTAAT